jgi:hypothetical protein
LEEPVAEEKLLTRIRGLLEKAESTTFEPEREALLAKAQKLMDQHRIDMAMLDFGKATASREPVEVRLNLGWSEWSQTKFSILYYIGEHCGVRVMVGMQDDIVMVELLFTVASLEFDSKINPVWDSEKSFDANVYALHGAGRKWKDIAFIANRHGGNPKTGQPGSTTEGTWLKTAYRRECARLGHEPRRQTQRHEAYRESFANSFLSTIVQRLAKMRKNADAERGGSIDNLPAVMSVKDKVNAKFWSMFPHLHPDELERQRQEHRAREKARWDALSPQERAREEKERNRPPRAGRSTYDEAGWAAGHSAAQRVDLLGGKNRVRNQEAIG